MPMAALIALDAALGALLGPANVWLMSQLLRSERTRQWLAFAPPGTRHLYQGTFWYLFALPCALATAIGAPVLIRYLQKLRMSSRGKYFRTAAVAGILFGLWVTSFAVFLSLIWLTLIVGGTAASQSMDSLVVAVLAALAFGPMIALLCLPAIIISGSLFGLLNARWVRPRAAALRT